MDHGVNMLSLLDYAEKQMGLWGSSEGEYTKSFHYPHSEQVGRQAQGTHPLTFNQPFPS